MGLLEIAFKQRVAELDSYFRILAALEKNFQKSGLNSKDPLPAVFRSEDTYKLLKASAFLVMYNIAEATVRDVVDSTWNAVETSKTPALTMIPQLRHTWVEASFRRKDVFTASPRTYREEALAILDIAAQGQIVQARFREIGGGGNVDHHKVGDLCLKHGVKFKPPKLSRDGTDLETIKNRRNILAHGDQSFSDIGSAYTLADLVDIKKRMTIYLRALVRTFDRHISRAHYKVA
ncbi:MAG: MAE_28990/MAE_18760 family HEPN-like nuclease [Nitrososphaerales archaeon]